MQNKKFLIATNSLGIGGCETYVITMAKELIRRKNNVTIVAGDGIFRKHIEDLGIKVKVLDFSNTETQIEKIKIIEQIIEDEGITDVCINPFFPFFEVTAACIKKHIPYDLFFHGVSLKGYFDIKNSFSALGVWSSIYIKNVAIKYARKYVYVSEEVRDFYEEYFNLNKDKGIILKNSIDLEQNLTETNKLKKFVMLSRIDADKIDSIKCAIKFYKKLYEKSETKNDMLLDILGTGNRLEELNTFVEDYKKYNVKVLKETNNSCNVIKDYDAVLGMGRTMIEAMSLKKFAILISYNKYIGVINAKNIKKMKSISYANFSGRNLENRDENCDIENILELNKEQILEITKDNYNYIFENQNIEINILEYLKGINEEYKMDLDSNIELSEYLNLIQHIGSIEKSRNEYQYEIEKYKKIQDKQKNEIEYYKNALNNIYNKKSYKLYKTLKNLISGEK